MVAQQSILDGENARFWSELCGSNLAEAEGITDRSPEALNRFDRAYFEFYPYLLSYVQPERLRGKKVLEVGLGFGSVGERLAASGADYVGMDVSSGPVDMMNYRLQARGLAGVALQRSFLSNELPSSSFDAVVSIGCFHHTGDLERCIDEVHRILRPGGTCTIMVYNRYSLRQWLRWPVRTLAAAVGRPFATSSSQRGAYDQNADGEAAPSTEFRSARELTKSFERFASVQAQTENCDELRLLKVTVVSRRQLLPIVGRHLGLDVYVRATK
ncbi:MAG: class I SAM-dependent methyltransferase [Polyangiaceae bacterium]|nr:class I SAM-dependent methyltransferase [Polyangiaceae bacterium]